MIDVFEAIRPRTHPPFPYLFPQLCVFLQLTDAEGEGPAWVSVRPAETDTEVFRSPQHRIQFPDRLHLQRTIFRLRRCCFPSRGLYFVEFYLDGQWIADRTLKLGE